MKIDEVAERYQVLKEVVERIKDVDEIEELYPPQEKAVERGIIKGKDSVLSVPTAAGKTLISELAMLRGILEERGKALYIVPLKALANQKYQEFKEKYNPLGVKVAISTGDFDSKDPRLKKYDIIVASSEKADSLIRHGVEWLQDLSVVVADETHLIDSPERGPTLEVTLTRLRELNPHLQFLLLSASLSNAEDLAEWIGGELIESSFRPVKLYEGIYHNGTIRFAQKEAYSVEDGRKRPVIALAKDTLEKEKQAIVFVSTRRSAEAVARRLSKVTRGYLTKEEKQKVRDLSDDIYHVLSHPTEQCEKIAKYVKRGAAFHHAGLCLPHSAKVQLADGRVIEIGKLSSEEAKRVKVMSLNPKTLKLEPRKVKKLWKRKAPSKLLKITTKSGRTLRLTFGHPLPTIERGKIKWKKAGTFREGTYIAIPRELPTDSNSDPKFINYLPQDVYVRDIKEFVNSIFRKLKEKKDCPTIKELAESYGSHHLFYNYKEGRAIPLPLLRKLAKEVGEEKKLTSKVRKIWAIGSQGNELKIPKKLNDDFLKLVYIAACFLRACYSSGSGPCRDRNTIEYTTCGREFALGLCSLLLLGIFPYLNKRKFKPQAGSREIKSKLPQYRVTYNLPNFLKFKDRVGYVDPYHKNILKRKETVSNKSYGNDVIPNFGKKLKAIRDKLDLSYKNINNYFPQTTWWRWENEKNPATRCNLKKLVEACKSIEENRCKQIPEVKELENLANSHIYWDKIEKIEKVNYDKKWVYDLSVEGSRNFVANNMIVHNSGKQKVLLEDNFRNGLIKFIAATPSLAMGVDLPAFRVIIRDSKRWTGGGMDWIPTLDYQQMSGRAGRPKYDPYGETILVAKSQSKIDELKERYIQGEPEAIDSKLAVEPTLRMYALTMICEGYGSVEELIDFFSKTFYGHIYGSAQALSSQIRRVLNQLREFGFIEMKAQHLTANALGQRVSELYIDPFTAHKLINFLREAAKEGFTVITALIAICDTKEMEPLPSVRKGEKERIHVELTKREEILAEGPNKPGKIFGSRYNYHRFQKAFKMALVFEDWIKETGEDAILDKYHVTPGTLFAKISTADWLLYATSELSKILGLGRTGQQVDTLRFRVQHGVSKKLLELVQIRGIGRVRARKLFKEGIKSIRGLKEAKTDRLQNILGPKLGKKIKKRAEEKG